MRARAVAPWLVGLVLVASGVVLPACGRCPADSWEVQVFLLGVPEALPPVSPAPPLGLGGAGGHGGYGGGAGLTGRGGAAGAGAGRGGAGGAVGFAGSAGTSSKLDCSEAAAGCTRGDACPPACNCVIAREPRFRSAGFSVSVDRCILAPGSGPLAVEITSHESLGCY